VDASAALAVPGVLRVLTAADVPGPNLHGIVHKDQPVLCADVLRHAGDPVALVLAQTPEALRDGRAVSGSIFHLAGPAPSDWTAYAEAFGRALDRRVRLLHTPWPLLGLAAWGNALLHALGLPTSHLTPDKGREARQEGWLLDDAKARRELGYRPRVALPQGAAGSIAWCQAEGLL